MSIFKRFARWFTWQRVPADVLYIEKPRREAAIAVLFALFFIAASAGTGMLIRIHPLPLYGAASFTCDFWYVVVFKILLLLVLPIFWFYMRGYNFGDMLPGWRLRAGTLIAIIISFIAGMSLNLLQGRHELVLEGMRNFQPPEAAIRLGLGIIVPLFMAAIPEEFVFRGFLQTRLERVSGRMLAVSVTAILFTAWHIPTRYLLAHGIEGTAGDLMSVIRGTGIPVLIIALIFGLFWDRYRSLLPLIAAHWGVDVLPTVVSFLGIDY
jgi:membrane protease YdiL (CAAX protease family)